MQGPTQQPCLDPSPLLGSSSSTTSWQWPLTVPVPPETVWATIVSLSKNTCFWFSDFSSLPPSLTLSQSALLKTWQQSQALCCCVTLQPWATISGQPWYLCTEGVKWRCCQNTAGRRAGEWLSSERSLSSTTISDSVHSKTNPFPLAKTLGILFTVLSARSIKIEKMVTLFSAYHELSTVLSISQASSHLILTAAYSLSFFTY